jgi:superfamily II DNA/RNA helicase
MSLTFADLGVPVSIASSLAERGITQPFEIQAATIADALAGRDVCGRAPTGSGKTLAFGIPLVASVERGSSKRPRALVLAPTRELAEQITTELEKIAGRVRVGVVYGGVSYTGQVNALRRGVDILVACPGRLEDLIQQRLADLGDVDRVVIDEADRMADMGFMPSVRRLLDQTATPRQTVLFSATLDGDVAKLTRDYQTNPVRHDVGEETPDLTAADHVFWRTGKTNRTELTVEAINAAWPSIIFSRTRHGSDRLARQLSQQGIAAAAIHGGRSQRQRNQALSDFAQGRVHALVATDVAARGIHVDGVASVIHYDLPEDHKAYIHRSGRTARAGRGGIILSLIQPDQVKGLRRMQREVGLDEPLVEPDAVALRALSDISEPPPAQHSRSPQRAGDAGPAASTRPRPRAGNATRPTRARSQPRSSAGNGSGRDNDERADGQRRGGIKLTSRSRAPQSQPAPFDRPPEIASPGHPGGGQGTQFRVRGRSGAKGRARASTAAGEPTGRGGVKSRGRRTTSTPDGNRKARRAHLQWGG